MHKTPVGKQIRSETDDINAIRIMTKLIQYRKVTTLKAL